MKEWRLRIDVGELSRNHATYTITPAERGLLGEFFAFLGTLDHPENHPDVCRIAQTDGRWFRVKVDDLRLVFEAIWVERILIWRMALRRADDTYDQVQGRREALYPQVKLHRITPLILD